MKPTFFHIQMCEYNFYYEDFLGLINQLEFILKKHP